MPVGLLVTVIVLLFGIWVMARLVGRRGTPRLARRRLPPIGRGSGDGLTIEERRRLYKRLGIDPATLRRYGRIDLLRLPPDQHVRPRSDAD